MDNNCNKFIEELYKFIQEKLAEDYPVKYLTTDHIYIGHKNFYIFIKNEFKNEFDLEYFEFLYEEYGITINIEIDINIYNKFYNQAMDDVSEIINWLINKNKEDFLLFDDQSVPFLYRRKGEVIIKKDYMYFPLERIKA